MNGKFGLLQRIHLTLNCFKKFVIFNFETWFVKVFSITKECIIDDRDKNNPQLNVTWSAPQRKTRTFRNDIIFLLLNNTVSITVYIAWFKVINTELKL